MGTIRRCTKCGKSTEHGARSGKWVCLTCHKGVVARKIDRRNRVFDKFLEAQRDRVKDTLRRRQRLLRGRLKQLQVQVEMESGEFPGTSPGRPLTLDDYDSFSY